MTHCDENSQEKLEKRPVGMKTRSQRALTQMTFVLVVAVVVVICISIWKLNVVQDIFLGDMKPVILNGVIILLFALGIGQLYRGLRHYAHEEEQVARFTRLRADGIASEAVFDDTEERSIIANRYFAIKSLFDRGVPINHSAISAIMVAEESLYQSFPRFVNNVLILTGVFGTVSSLIFALIGASDVLQTAVPGEGMGVMLLGMNTALTTTATAIVCYFFFTYFYQKLMDVQTYLFSRVERAVLIYIIPDFAFDSESIDHQTKFLVEEVRNLVREMYSGMSNVERTLARLNDHNEIQIQKWNAILASQEDLNGRMEGMLSHLDEVRKVLMEGFRLK